MKKLFEHIKSHFLYTRQQRNGILLLLGLIFSAQMAYHQIDFRSATTHFTDDERTSEFQKQIDSLRQLAIANSKPKIYPFNPNFISDYKGYQLGMSIQEIDRLHVFRSQKKLVNSAEEFQQVTKISDSLLSKISPHFKFPDWVKKRNRKKMLRQARLNKANMTFDHEVKKEVSLISTTDINKATLTDFLAVEGVDEFISERIIKYRSKLRGFVFEDQIYEVWGLDKTVGDSILKTFSVQSIPQIQKININTAQFKEVLAIPYIDYDLCVKIFDYRDEVAELQDSSELKNIEGFPLHKYDRIVVYLFAE